MGQRVRAARRLLGRDGLLSAVMAIGLTIGGCSGPNDRDSHAAQSITPSPSHVVYRLTAEICDTLRYDLFTAVLGPTEEAPRALYSRLGNFDSIASTQCLLGYRDGVMAAEIATFKSGVGSNLARKTDCKSILASTAPTTLPTKVEQAHTIVDDNSYLVCVVDGNLYAEVTVLRSERLPFAASDLQGPVPTAAAAFIVHLLTQLH